MKNPLLLTLTLSAAITSSATAGWPAWRGDIAGSGTTKETNLPVEWGEDKNVRWRVELPERGNSTPVATADRIFVTQAVESEKFRGLYCFDRKDGTLLWKRGLTYKKAERTHRTNPYCSASPATDGSHVYAYYGSAGLTCYDLDGNERWHRDFGAVDHEWGNSSSPVLFGDLCIQYHGPGTGARLIAVNKNTGETAWEFKEPTWDATGRTDGFRGRDNEGIIGSFSTPIIIETPERHELIMSFPTKIVAFDPKSGDDLWSCNGLNPLVYTSPVISGDTVVALGGYHGNSIAVKVGGSSNVTDTHRLWRKERDDGGIGSGVAKDGFLYYHNSGGIASCLDLKTGEKRWEERLPGKGKSWGSFMLAGDLVYTLSQPGDSVVFKANPEKFEVVAQSDLGETTNSSIVPSNGELIIRTHEALWCIKDGS